MRPEYVKVNFAFLYLIWFYSRTAIIEREGLADAAFPFPLDFNPGVFHILTTDNFDNNVPGGSGEAIHTLASLVAIPNPVIQC